MAMQLVEPAHQPSPIGRPLDGEHLTIEQLVHIARNPGVTVELDLEAKRRVGACAALVNEVATKYVATFKEAAARKENRESLEGLNAPVLDYGITTGFGEFKRVPIHHDDLEPLQRNILLSHAVGVGESANENDPANYFAPEVVRAALVLRINTFMKGNSGVRLELVEALRTMLNRNIVPLVPIRGSVGSSGDLCPLSHLFVVLLADGRAGSRFVVVSNRDGVRSLDPSEARPGTELGSVELGFKPMDVSYKEGLALTNGAAFSTAMLALAVHDAIRTANTADVALAMTLEAARGCARAFDSKPHEVRPYRGQQDSARNVRCLLNGSRLIETADDVQDPYSLRCAPQVHGASRDTIAYARMIVECEMNSATDNPLFFPGEDRERRFEKQFTENWKFRMNGEWNHEPYDGNERYSYSAGNFHGQPVGLAADFLAIALAELANISERRTQMLLDGSHNRGLPPNLIPKGGMNSGFMIAQYAAAGIVSENKVLCHPASVDSIPTSSNSEDHNSMSTIAARKLRTVLGNTQAVLAMELLAAAQAIEWATLRASDARKKMQQEAGGGAPISPERSAVGSTGKTSAQGENDWYASSEERKQKGDAETRHFLSWVGEPADDGAVNPNAAAVTGLLGVGTAAAYRAIRSVAPAITTDVLLEPLARRVRALVEGKRYGIALVDLVDGALDFEKGQKLRPVAPLRSGELPDAGGRYADC